MNYYGKEDKKNKLINALLNDMSTDIKFPKTQITKIIQSGGFLGSLLSKIAVPLIKIAVLLAKNILAPIKDNSCCFNN